MILLASVFALALTSAPATPAARLPVNRVAATVNGDVITFRELEQAGGSALQEANLLAPGPERDRARAAALRAAFDLLVADRLFSQQVKKLDLEVGDAQVDAQIDEIKQQNHFDDEQLDQALSAQGTSRKAFRERLRGQLQNYAVLQYKVGSLLKVTDQDLENYYRSHPQEFAGEDEVFLRHIFLPYPAATSDADRKRIEDAAGALLQRVKKGEDFAKVAREASKGQSANSGGDLGWLKRGSIQKPLEDAAFALSKGQISGLVHVPSGVHILQVTDRRRTAARTFADVKETIRDRLIEEQADRYRVQFVAELRNDAVIEAKLPELAQQP